MKGCAGTCGRRAQRGMTLLELTVALAIFAVIGAGLYGVFSRTVAGRDYAAARAGTYAEARAVMDRIERDMRGCFASGDYNAELRRFWADPAEAFSTDSDARTVVDLTTLSARGVVSPEAAPFPRAAGPPRGDQVRVLYRLDDNGTLMRYEVQPPKREAIDLETASGEVLARGVLSLRLRFYDRGEWLDSWSSAASGSHRDQAPELVETTLELEAPEGPPVELTSAVTLPLARETGGK